MDRHQTGRDAEERAARIVADAGFTVLWRNVRIGPLELDLVAKRGDLAIIVEVRARGAGAFAGPLESVTWEKRRTLLRAAHAVWRGRLRKMKEIRRVRIDVIAIAGDHLEWIKGAVTDDR